jgi:thioredoxin 1
MVKLVEIYDSQFNNLVLKSALPVLLECASPECIICKTMGDRIQEVAKEYASQMVFLRMDINENKKWQQYNVRVIPTLLYFKDGVLVGRQDTFPDVDDIRGQIKLMLGPQAPSGAFDVYGEVRTAIGLEQIAARFYNHLSVTAKNGRVKERFKLLQQESLMHKDILLARLQEVAGESYTPDASTPQGMDMIPQGFSLVGAMKMALKIEERLLTVYKKAQKGKLFMDSEQGRKLIKDETAHAKVLQKEMRFLQNNELFSPMEKPDYPSWLQKVFE